MPDGVTVAQQILALFVWVRILVRQPIYIFAKLLFGVWHSLVVRLVRDQEAGGSSPSTPTIIWRLCIFFDCYLLLIYFAPLAQLDRVFGYEPKGRGFESLVARQVCCIYMQLFCNYKLFFN